MLIEERFDLKKQRPRRRFRYARLPQGFSKDGLRLEPIGCEFSFMGQYSTYQSCAMPLLVDL